MIPSRDIYWHEKRHHIDAYVYDFDHMLPPRYGMQSRIQLSLQYEALSKIAGEAAAKETAQTIAKGMVAYFNAQPREDKAEAKILPPMENYGMAMPKQLILSVPVALNHTNDTLRQYFNEGFLSGAQRFQQRQGKDMEVRRLEIAEAVKDALLQHTGEMLSEELIADITTEISGKLADKPFINR